MSDHHNVDSRVRTAVILALVAASGISIHGYLPDARGDRLAGMVAVPVLLTTAVLILCLAFFVSVRRYTAYFGEWNRAMLQADGSGEAIHLQRTQGPRMRTLVITGICLVPLAEFIALCLPNRGDVHALAGIVVGLLMLGMCSQLRAAKHLPTEQPEDDEARELLQRWTFRTQALIGWADGSRSDWDKRVRPVVARHFETATKVNQRRTTDPAAFQATGTMVFGAELWQWVDPDNVARGSGSLRRGPGRRTLEDILRCLEQV
ncbi:hypothetical protein [Mycolicibacterium komossense]|uniref:Uncharacterized protein n=1 Tax=Mycolicibacterium komossense TaxID=1779 RepID=A0ABT3CIW1_9MYCO|nr:hypothetical protein [Mycolicibacterium komossense]MCV7229438.1 hypothetical protein [Mycolicibacterium komossense]